MRKRNVSPGWESEGAFLTPITEHARVLSRVVTPVPRKPQPDIETASASFVNQQPFEIENEIPAGVGTGIERRRGMFTYRKAALLTLFGIVVALLLAWMTCPKQFTIIFDRIRLQIAKPQGTWLCDLLWISIFFLIWTTFNLRQSSTFIFPIALYRTAAFFRQFVGVRLKQEVNGVRPKTLHDVMKGLPVWVRRYYAFDSLMLPRHAKAAPA
ncbi:hypothetical protein KEM54_000021 [Ascosphaera aggregata]|nr:hypothetical protein KEM54_000021 [Ascosphaera aggregata]